MVHYCSMKYYFYICTVKTVLRHDVADLMQRFLCPNLLVIDTERIMECGSGNTRKVIAEQCLTAPCALFCLMSKKVLYYG